MSVFTNKPEGMTCVISLELVFFLTFWTNCMVFCVQIRLSGDSLKNKQPEGQTRLLDVEPAFSSCVIYLCSRISENQRVFS